MARITTLTALLLVVTACGCEKKTETATPDAPASTAGDASPSDATLVALQKADLVDGTEDHVISKCYVCSLGMDGKEEFAVDVHGYSAHLCSSTCRDHFQESSESVIADTKIPE
ncbi:MAG: hypothetical protein KDB00_16945 [Planctomycetales bacterium]|nr:hypothetical protein [Planctomycetales bacterium]